MKPRKWSSEKAAETLAKALRERYTDIERIATHGPAPDASDTNLIQVAFYTLFVLLRKNDKSLTKGTES